MLFTVKIVCILLTWSNYFYFVYHKCSISFLCLPLGDSCLIWYIVIKCFYLCPYKRQASTKVFNLTPDIRPRRMISNEFNVRIYTQYTHIHSTINWVGRKERLLCSNNVLMYHVLMYNALMYNVIMYNVLMY